jgi:alkylation response protein AidB-like acyl-CoA dehydrogenase
VRPRGESPKTSLAKGMRLGFLGVFIPEAYGGARLGFLEHCFINEEF